MLSGSELIVLHYTKIRETSLVLHCLSPRWGRRGFLTSVSKSSGTALFQPLGILEATVVENTRSSLWRLRDVTAAFSLNGIRSNIHKNTMSMFMSEVLYRTVHEGDTEDGLFDWCRRSILTLDALENDFSNFHLRFLIELAAEMGFSPTAAELKPFSGVYADEIEKLVNADFNGCMMTPLSGAARNGIVSALLKYLEYHSGERINVRSLQVLRDLYV